MRSWMVSVETSRRGRDLGESKNKVSSFYLFALLLSCIVCSLDFHNTLNTSMDRNAVLIHIYIYAMDRILLIKKYGKYRSTSIPDIYSVVHLIVDHLSEKIGNFKTL